MYIKDIILDGFKCYEDTTVLRNLDKSYNAVTGLNGSGKSNVIDAIVFALGLESKKILRTNTLKELINVHRKDCRVTLVLSNAEKEKSPPGYREYDEITISRSLDSSGKSKFFLNNHGCSQSTISKLCASIGINAEKGEFFFIVMQGHITKVLSMKSKEIGALVEETAGTRSYTKEKDKALQVLEKKEIKLKEVKDAMERRISPFYDRLIEEREAFVEEKRVEEKKKRLEGEIEELKSRLKKIERARKMKELKECQEKLRVDTLSLQEIEEESEELDSGEIRAEIEDEKLKLEDSQEGEDYAHENELYKENDMHKKRNLHENDLNSSHTLADTLAVLREKETMLVSLRGGGDMITKMEELTRLEAQKIEMEYRVKSIRLDPDYSEDKIQRLEKYSGVDIQAKTNRLAFLKSRINYPFVEGVYGTVGESIRLDDEKYREAITTVMGNKARHIIVRDEVVGGSLLKGADRRISVIPLSKIRTKPVPFETLKKVKEMGGVNALEVIKFDPGLRKAIEHVFSSFFLFTRPEEAKRACFDHYVYCVTLDGVVYDPKGTVTGGKAVYRVEVVSRKEIEGLEEEVERYKREFNRSDYERLKKQREMAREKRECEERAKALDMKIELLKKDSDVKKELEDVRREILRLKKREMEESKKKEEEAKRKELEKSKKEEKERRKKEKEEARRRIEVLEERLKKSRSKSGELEPKQKYLIRAISKMKSRIQRLTQELSSEVGDDVEDAEDDLDDDEQSLESRLNTALLSLRSITTPSNSTRKSIRMDPSNFTLLEKYDLDIRTLKEKIRKIERDKANILASITNFDSLGVKEVEKAFSHINRKLGVFLQYFLKDSDSKIIKEGDSYQLRVKIGNWKDSLVELSGGQRSLVALCLIFSMLTYNPAPFYIFDEIDAALDLNYTQSIGEIIKREFNNAQFIIISLKNGMYDNANSVYKVFIKDGKSKIAQIK